MHYAAPAPDPFVREHVSHPENRTNLALFALLNVAAFRDWFLSALNLDADAIVYPPQNVGGGRPDFVVVDPALDRVRAWIEVELGGANQQQLDAYRANLHDPVKSIVGPKSLRQNDDLSLEEIAEYVDSVLLPILDPQARVTARMLIALVREMVRPIVYASYVVPNAALIAQPLLQTLSQRMGPILRSGGAVIPPGYVQVTTQTQKGWTLRVHAKGNFDRSVSVMWSTSAGSGTVRIPSRSRLERCLGSSDVAEMAIAAYVGFLHRFGLDIGTIGESANLPLDEAPLFSHVDELATYLTALASIYHRVPLATC